MRAHFCGIRFGGDLVRSCCFVQSKCDWWNKSIGDRDSGARPPRRRRSTSALRWKRF